MNEKSIDRKKPHIEQILNNFPYLRNLKYEDPKETEYFGVLNFGILKRLNNIKQHIKKYKLSDISGFECRPEIISIWAMIIVEKCKIYKMAREFSEELIKIDLDVAAKYIPISEKMICIEFPDNIRFSLGGFGPKERFAKCVYCFVTDEKTETEDGFKIERYMEMTFPLYDCDGNLTYEIHQFGLPIDDVSKKFSVLLEEIKNKELEILEKKGTYSPMEHGYIFQEELFSFVLKCYLYIYSGEPDLRNYRPDKPPKTNKAKKLRIWHKQHENMSMIDLILVGFNFKKSVIYKIDSTTVCGHFRWQPYGTGLSMVKLIWIDSYERKFSNHTDYTTSNPQNPN